MATPTNLYQYYTQNGGQFAGYGSAQRNADAARAGITNYTGDENQNQQLLAFLQGSPAPTPATPNSAVTSSNTARNLTTNNQSSLDQYQNPLPPEKPAEKGKTIADMIKTAESGQDPNQIAIDNEVNTFTNALDTYATNLNARTQAMVESIKTSYARRKEEQAQLNKDVTGGTTVAGIRSGRNRYATELQDNIIADQTSQGLKQLADLDAEEQSLILQAQAANDDKQYELLNKRMSAVQDAREKKNQIIQSLYQLQVDADKNALDAAKEARDVMKFNRTEGEGTAKSIAGTLTDATDKEIQAAAESYGIDPNVLMTQVKDYRIKEARAKRIASGANKSPSTLSQNEADSLHLPQALVGKSDKDIIFDLSLSTVPTWFKSFLAQTEPGKTFDEYGLKDVWNNFRNSDDMKVYQNTVDLSSRSQFEQGGSNSDIQDLLDALNE